MSAGFVLAVDQGTSSSRAVLYDAGFQPVASAQQEFEQIFPQPGWVEHDPESIWATVRETVAAAMQNASAKPVDVVAVGITNQRETTLVWDRQTGECVYNAIVWQDRRTAGACDGLRADGAEDSVIAKTGLRLDPYFSATKIAWLLDNVEGARARAESGQLAFGTVDTFLLWRMTGGAVHATDATNASRTMLFNIHTQDWDEELLEMFGVPRQLMPEVKDCATHFGDCEPAAIGIAAPILGIAGDQQAALIGQAGVERGITKSTYGTGCFVIANTGPDALASHNKLLTTVASRLDGAVTYGLEGSVFVAGSAIQWLRDELRIIEAAPDSEDIARSTGIVEDVHVVPAFAGLGAPYWDAHARGAILGLTRGSGREEIVTATLQAIAYQTHDLVHAMSQDGIDPSTIRVDGGMVANRWFLQFLADILGVTVERPANVESTVLGAAYLAGLAAGIIDSTAALPRLWQSETLFEPTMPDERRKVLLAGWADAVARARSGDR